MDVPNLTGRAPGQPAPRPPSLPDLSWLRPGRRAWWLTKQAAYGGGGLGMAGGLSYALLKAEARLARRLISSPKVPPVADGWYGDRRSGGPVLRLALLGDSAAAGIGADTPATTPGALLAEALAEATGRRVHLRVHAVTGSDSADLAGQVERCLLEQVPDLVVLSIGANDVTHLVPPQLAAPQLGEAVRRLAGARCHVVVGTCPDLGSVRPIAPPLRWVARYRSRRMAAAQRSAVTAAGGSPVALGELLGPTFARTTELFSSDRFHPSGAGYRLLASALLPALREAVGLEPVAADMVEMADAVDAVKSARALRSERDEADWLVWRFWRRLREGRSADAQARRDEDARADALDADDAAEAGQALEDA